MLMFTWQRLVSLQCLLSSHFFRCCKIPPCMCQYRVDTHKACHTHGGKARSHRFTLLAHTQLAIISEEKQTRLISYRWIVRASQIGTLAEASRRSSSGD
ncbi:hypothetical protein BDW42DRAFT_159250 [Aspergillus taichungensis]|uniref:Secreted protein n=1 Tax=Aspergillus taichungensis TaxID=482145 RepID=A0A2J5I7U5_9EURO|nr:hypothetical protein BDW42DRAFT_159250 [Aspergillus taichungensis]